MRLSKAGLIAVAIYAVPAMALVAYALSLGDAKGQFVFMQIALLPAMVLVGISGLVPFVIAPPWLNTYWVSGLLSVLIVYGLGALIGRLWASLKTPPSDAG